MGVSDALARFFIKKKNEFNFRGRLLTIGKQEINFGYKKFNKMLGKSVYKTQVPITDEIFFKSLGFKEVLSLDYYHTPGVFIECDLNYQLEITESMKADYVIDCGTMEHCFNIAMVMSNIVRLTNLGGSVLHVNSSQGHCNHGFYNFQPTFYFSFYQANGFDNFKCYFLESSDLSYKGKAIITPISKNLNNMDFRTKNTTGIIFKADKVSESESIKFPIQEFYRRIFEEKEKRNWNLLPDKLYRNILGDVKGNLETEIRKYSYEI